VIHHGSWSRAAERGEVSQLSLSRTIRSLEAELGGELFRREGRNTHLSELGQMVRPHLELVFSATANAKRISRDLATMNIVPLKLGIMSTIAPDEIVDLIDGRQNMLDWNSGFPTQVPTSCGTACSAANEIPDPSPHSISPLR
jgi:DNA-binding transcriptional LysR family regulator